VTKTTPVAELYGMAFENPPLTADTNRTLTYFFPLPIDIEGQREEMYPRHGEAIFFQKLLPM
jgi:hypothetical protein